MASFGQHPSVTQNLGQILELTFQGHQTYVSICFDDINMMVLKEVILHKQFKSYSRKIVMSEKDHFGIHWPLEPKLLTLGEIRWKIVAVPLQELSNVFFLDTA